MKTGVFFHEEFKNKDWPIIGDKFGNFPQVMEKALALPDMQLFEPHPVNEELLYKVHTHGYLQEVKRAWYYKGATLAVGGCVEAGEKIARGELRNALVFSVGAGHHASPDSAWGGTYLSCIGPAIARLTEISGKQRYAIVDTDRHHGDGTRAVFEGNSNVLHVCFCYYNNIIEHGTKIDINIDGRIGDKGYLEKVRSEFFPRVRDFNPYIIFHNLGHDTAQGDYGDVGLTREFYLRLVKEVKTVAEEICEGRYIIITHGGSRIDVAEYIFPRIAQILAGQCEIQKVRRENTLK
jgi:acetoin utilization deacetylase AcuC-like enzyme